jgi:hypothetical protein
VLVEVAEVVHGRVSAVLANAFSEAVVQTLAVAALALAEVVCVWVEAQESDEGVELSHSVLQRSSCEAPPSQLM